jgi:autotransporter translocation and assembly factor TamB
VPSVPPVFPQPQKEKLYQRVWFWLVMGVAVVLGLGGCLSVIAGHRHMAAFVHSAHVTSTITYSVTGTGQAKNITYATLQGGSRQSAEARVPDVTLPWSKTIAASGLFLSFDVSATNGDGGGSIACSITEDGQPLVSSTTKGAFATANCSYAG